jgi:cation transport ATPase
VFAEVLPSKKAEKVAELRVTSIALSISTYSIQTRGHIVAMVGDGINDSIALVILFNPIRSIKINSI